MNVIISIFPGMLERILGNVEEDSGEYSRGSRRIFRRFQVMFKRIPRHVRKDSGECLKRFRGMFKKIRGNVRSDSGECPRRFRGMLKKISGNLNLFFIKFCN